MRVNIGRLVRITAVVGVVGTAFLGTGADAWAGVGSCTATCNSNCSLDNDVSCNNQDGIVLSGGADLDLNGHSITCTSNCPQAAIKMSAGNSVVKDTVGGAVVDGPFTYGVNCQSQSNSEVAGITIDGATNAIYNCAKIHQNLLIGGSTTGSMGIAVADLAASDYVIDNWVEGFAVGIGAARTHAIDIEGNTIGVLEIPGQGAEIGLNALRASGTPTVNVTYNSFFGDGTSASFMTIWTGVTYKGNFCDPDNPLCASCTNCRQPVAPIN